MLAQGFLADGLPPSASALAAEQQLASSVWQSAQVLAFRDCFHAIALAFAGLFLLMPFMPPGRGRTKSPAKPAKDDPALARIR
jgi:hypothetical protein